MERLRGEFDRCRRTGDPLAIIVFDIDDFKLVNDSLGHAGGDEVLKETARRVSSVVRKYDLAARVGGDEFLVVAPNTGADEALGLAERVCRSFTGIRSQETTARSCQR